jgi:hypothetical protein
MARCFTVGVTREARYCCKKRVQVVEFSHRAIQQFMHFPFASMRFTARSSLRLGFSTVQRRSFVVAGSVRIKMATDSTGSHMANVAFDKYVQFCEEYAEGFHKALDTLVAHGPTEKVLSDAAALYKLRRKWRVWITTDTDEKLEQFEQALRDIGASAGYVQATLGDPNAQGREIHINRMHTRLAQVMGYKEWAGKEVGDELAHYTLDALLRRILGTEQFDELRTAVISRAMNGLGSGKQSSCSAQTGKNQH